MPNVMAPNGHGWSSCSRGARRKAKVAAVALANKNARIIWAMMVEAAGRVTNTARLNVPERLERAK